MKYYFYRGPCALEIDVQMIVRIYTHLYTLALLKTRGLSTTNRRVGLSEKTARPTVRCFAKILHPSRVFRIGLCRRGVGPV